MHELYYSIGQLSQVILIVMGVTPLHFHQRVSARPQLENCAPGCREDRLELGIFRGQGVFSGSGLRFFLGVGV